MEEVSLGQHLTPPEGCPSVIQSLIFDCCKQSPGDRTTFAEITQILSEDNLKVVMANSNPTYAQERPLDYSQDYLALTSKHNQNQENDFLSISNAKLREKPSSWQFSNNNVCIGSKCVSTPLLTELQGISVSSCIETETQYTTVIIGNEKDETEE